MLIIINYCKTIIFVCSITEYPWRKYRIEIYSDSIRTIPIHSDICIRANANHSEPFRTNPKNVLYLVWWKTVKNQCESFRAWIPSDWFWLKIRLKSIRARIDLDWKLGFGLVRIHSDWCLGINRIKSDWFLTVCHQTRYKTFFILVGNDSH